MVIDRLTIQNYGRLISINALLGSELSSVFNKSPSIFGSFRLVKISNGVLMLINQKEAGMLYDDLYLAHHGIKGQRWGIRRYQNKDGSLTEAGKERYKNILSKTGSYYYRNPNNVYRMTNNVVKIDSNTDLIKKNTRLTRATTSAKETLDEKAKYLTLTDLNESENYAAWLGEAKRGQIYLDTYSLKKDIKIANADMVKDYLLTLSNPKVSELPVMSKTYNRGQKEINTFIKKNKNLTLKDIYHKNDIAISNFSLSQLNTKFKKMDSKIIARSNVSTMLMEKLAQDVLYKNVKKGDIYKHFTNMGYDGIVDAEDSGTVTTYPLIIFNPKNVLKFENSRTW